LKGLHAVLLGICLCTLSLAEAAGQTNQVDQSALSKILSRHVNAAGWVDYTGLRQDRPALKSYLATLRNVDVARLPSDSSRLAFWIDAYNAFTLDDVLEYVEGKTDSVKKVDGFFDKHTHPIAEQMLTLDEIEKRGREMHDPRIHFAINCASASCPKLRPYAYSAEDLNRQLDQVTGEFFADSRRGLRLDRKNNTLYLSPILKWYAGDFSGATSATGEFLSRARAAFSGDNVLEFVLRHVSGDVATYIRQSRPSVKYMDYDWTLNSQKLHATGQQSRSHMPSVPDRQTREPLLVRGFHNRRKQRGDSSSYAVSAWRTAITNPATRLQPGASPCSCSPASVCGSPRLWRDSDGNCDSLTSTVRTVTTRTVL